MNIKMKSFFGIIIVLLLLNWSDIYQIDNINSVFGTSTSTSAQKLISIDGNTHFDNTAVAEGWPGNGSAADPYIISGYYMILSGTNFKYYIPGMRIKNTNRHFIVQHCTYYYPTAWDSRCLGFDLENVENGVF